MTANQPSPPSRISMQEKRLSIPSKLDQVESVCRFIDESARSAGFDEKESYACQLAVTEACENIILHGYQGANGEKITVKIKTRPGDLMIKIIDQAPPFNPAEPLPEKTASPDDPPIGGLGLVILNKVMDEVEYKRTQSGNTLRLRKTKKS